MTMRRIVPLLLLAVLAASPALAADAPAFAVDGRRVTVRTDRYAVEFDGLTMTRVENLLTGETYAAPPVPEIADTTGVAIESLRPAVPVKLYGLSDRSRMEVKDVEGGAIVSYSGLQCGEEFDAGLRCTLMLTVDAATGDLVIEPSVHAEIEEVFGVRDRGVLHCAVRFGPLGEGLRVIIPASDGFSVTKDTVPADWSYGARWPQFWEAALLIAEGERGCLGLWADEPALRYGRLLDIRRAGGWNVTLAFETSAAIYECTEMKDAAWRFNVFDGYWVRAAERYVQQMERQWPDLKRLSDSPPAWADKVRIVISGPTPGVETAQKYAALVPKDSLAVFTCQEWLKGWNDNAIAKLDVGMDYFPNWPLDNPSHYEGTEAVAEKFTALEPMGVHCFPYTNPTIVTWGHPWLRGKVGPRAFLAYRFWQRFHPELCRDVVNTYGVSGIYEDCSWVVARHSLGEPDGDNWYNGSAHMRQYFRQLMPEVAVMGERNNEVTFRGQKFALSITQWGDHAHPIGAYIFGPFLRMWNLQLQPSGFDADDVRGWMTPWPFQFEDDPIQERLMIRRRGIIFAREQLRSDWPATWDPAVMHYLRAADGTEYRFVRDHGTRFVKITPSGEETIYWRLHGVTDAVVGDAGVEGWLGYDGERIVGLNPRGTYITLDAVKRPPVVICGVPEGFAVSRCVVRDGFWVAAFAPVDPKGPAAEAQLCTVRVRSGVPEEVSFCGAESARKVGKDEYEVQVELPGGLGAYWIAPGEIQHGNKLSAFPARNTVQRADTGLVSQYGGAIEGDEFQQAVGAVTSGEEGTVAWLLQMPEFSLAGEQVAWLVFDYGSMHPYGDGADYKVRVNGQTLWERYRPEQGKPDPKTPDQPQPVPLSTGGVNLTEFCGQTIVLELSADGHQTSVSESVRWHHPTLQTTVPASAETDEPTAPPVLPGGDL